MVVDAAEYGWSSAVARTTACDASGILDVAYWSARFTPEQWRVVLQGDEDIEAVESLRSHTHTGRPLGSKEFVVELGRTLHRALEPRAVGRPRKPSANAIAAGAGSAQACCLVEE